MAGVGEEGAEAAQGREAIHADLLPPSLPAPASFSRGPGLPFALTLA